MLRKVIAGLTVALGCLMFMSLLPDYVQYGASPYYLFGFGMSVMVGTCGMMLWRAQSELDKRSKGTDSMSVVP